MFFSSGQPVDEQEDKENAAAGKQYGRRLLYRPKHPWVVGKGRGNRVDRAQAGHGGPYDEPGEEPPHQKDGDKNPPDRNQRRAFFPIVERTSALMMALSMLDMVSKRIRPSTIRIIDTMLRTSSEEINNVCHGH